MATAKSLSGRSGLRPSYPGLDGLRGVAALAILVNHLIRFVSPALYQYYHGYLAVDLFFMLSGFVIANAYEARLESGALRFGDFVRLRLARFMPLAVLGTLLGFAGLFLTPSGVDGKLATALLGPSLFLVPQFVDVNGSAFPLNLVLWTLFLELVVNFAYAGLVRHLKPVRLAMIAGVSFVAMVVFSLQANDACLGFRTRELAPGLARVLFGFPLGVLIYRYRLQLTALPVIRRLSALTSAAGLAAVLVAAFCLCGLAPAGRWRVIYDLAVIPTLLPLLLILGANIRLSVRSASVFALVGGLSYPLYAIHIPIVQAGERISSSPVMGLLVTVAVLAASWLAWRHFDQPLQAAMKRRLLVAQTT